ncbi:hypothetical protein N7495_006228 [Penicillium taxi]|uniref:uncharacterized protein n=1 Tax=Penicillium taxi TaxID=168475 RepID=UPI00254577EC|nr:uncharacterized protein N7495_006228 [Penicillium taxi]KAJ5894537.1 hypothetical protein N7495_006228 [Penicillium taxi]
MVGNFTIKSNYEYESALRDSASDDKVDDAMLPLDKKADVDAQGGELANDLQAAAYEGNLDVVKLLLDKGADLNIQGGEYGNCLQAAACGGHLDVVKLLLSQGANIDILTVDSRGASLLHSAVACKDRETLNFLLEAGAHIYIAEADAFNQTPLHIAASYYPEAFQILENSLNLAAKNDNMDAWALMRVAINKEDIDGCTPLHRAVENRTLEAAEWLINHGANVDIEDFNKTTPFQRASQLKDFSMMSHLFPHVTKNFIKATDWRACTPPGAKRNIVLAPGGLEIPPVQLKDSQELTQYFNAMSYSLNFPTTSISAQGDKCVATTFSQGAVV